MKTTGILRRMDELGRVTLPIELRRALDWNEGDRIEISAEGDRVILRKRQELCVFCGAERGLTEYRGKQVCRACLDGLGRVR